MALMFGNGDNEFAIFSTDAGDLGFGGPLISGNTSAVSGQLTFLTGDFLNFGRTDIGNIANRIFDNTDIEGVKVVGLDVDNLTLEFKTDNDSDLVVLDGIGNVIDDVANGVTFGDGATDLKVFTFDAENPFASSGTFFDAKEVSDEFADIVGPNGFFNLGLTDLSNLFEEVLLQGGKNAGVDGVELVAVDNDNITLKFDDKDDDVDGSSNADYIVFDQVDTILDEFDTGPVNFRNNKNEFTVVTFDEDKPFAGGLIGSNTSFISDELAGLVGDFLNNGATDLGNLFTEVLSGDGVERVDLVTVDDDTVTLAFNDLDRGGKVWTDIVVFDQVGSILADIEGYWV